MGLGNRVISFVLTTTMVWNSAVMPAAPSTGGRSRGLLNGLSYAQLQSADNSLQQRELAGVSSTADKVGEQGETEEGNAQSATPPPSDAESKTVPDPGAASELDPEPDSASKSTSDPDDEKAPVPNDDKKTDADETSNDNSGQTNSTAQQNGQKESAPQVAKGVITHTLKSTDGHAYRVSITCDEAAGIPSDAQLKVVELTRSPTKRDLEDNPEAYKDRPYETEQMVSSEELSAHTAKLSEVLDVAESDYVFWNKLLRISLVTADGQEVQPTAPVPIEVETEALEAERAASLEAALVDGDAVALEVADRSSRIDRYTDDEGEDHERLWSKISVTTDRLGGLGLAGVVTPVHSWELRGGTAELLAPRHNVQVDVNELDATAPEGQSLMPELAFQPTVQLPDGVSDPSRGRGYQLWVHTKNAESDDAPGTVVAWLNAVNGTSSQLDAEKSPAAILAGDTVELLLNPTYAETTLTSGDVTLTGELPQGAEPDVADRKADFVDPKALSGDTTKTGEGEQLSTVAAYDLGISVADSAYEPDDARPVKATVAGEAVAGADADDLEVWRVDEDGTAEAVDAKADDTSVSFDATEPGTYLVVERTTLERTVTASDGKTYKVSVGFGPDAKLPKDTQLQVRELMGDELNDYNARTADALGDKLAYMRAFDITLSAADGTELEPKAKVDVSIQLMDDKATEETKVVHFAETGADKSAEVLEAKATKEDAGVALDFQAESFSVYAVAYTVDFHWGEYEYSMQGGKEIYLSTLLDELGTSIAKSMPEDSAKLLELAEDMGQVKNVSFSNPNLVGVERKTNEANNQNGTNGQIDNDWLLTSLAAFDSEERLTVVLMDGSEIVIRVTDEVVADSVCKIGDTGYVSLEEAIKAAPQGESTIELLTDVEIDKTVVLYGSNGNSTNNHVDAKGKTITIATAAEYSGSGTVATVSRKAGFADGSLVQIEEGTATLKLANATLDGKNISADVNGSLVSVKQGSLILNDGAVLQNGVTTHSGGAVYANGTSSRVVMNSGSIIRDCRSGDNTDTDKNGGGICLDNATLIMNDGSAIQRCIAQGNEGKGGGVFVNGAHGSFTMDGGVIEDCEAQRHIYFAGGGVCLHHGIFTMNNGTIRNCHATATAGNGWSGGWGGGLAVNHGEKAYMNGGLITGCTATKGGAAVECHEDLFMYGGTITGNHGGTANGVSGAVNFYDTGSRLFVHGSPKIYGNYDVNGNFNDVAIRSNSGNITVDGDMGADATIGVNKEGTFNPDEQFGLYSTDTMPANLNIFYADLDESLVGMGFKNSGHSSGKWLIWARGIRVVAKMYTGDPANAIEIKGSRGSFTTIGDFDGTSTDSEKIVTLAVNEAEQQYRTTKGYGEYLSLVDSAPDFKFARVEGGAGDNITYLRSKLTRYHSTKTLNNYYSINESSLADPNRINQNQFEELEADGTIVFYYKISPKAKITDADGNLLAADAYGNPALFGKLETAFSHVSKIYSNNSGAYASYSDPMKIKMLVPEYGMAGGATVAGNYDVTLTTAGAEDAEFPGPGGSSVIKNQGVTNQSMINTSLTNLTLGQVTLDGAHVATSADGSIVNVGSGVLTVTNGATLRKGSTSGKGGAVYVADGACLTMDGGLITGNTSQSGGAVNVGGPSARLNFSGNSVITGNIGSGEAKNVVLDLDTASVIRTSGNGLGGFAAIGIYVDGDKEANLYRNRGVASAVFGSYSSGAESNLEGIFSDRDSLRAEKGASEGEIRWKADNNVARVSNDGGESWTYFEALVTMRAGTADEVPGAFNYANTLAGDVIIETLRHGNTGAEDDTKLVGDEIGRYTLAQGYTFNKKGITSLTIRTKPGYGFRSTLTKSQSGTKTPMIIFDIVESALTIDGLEFDGGGSAQRTSGKGGIVRVTKNTSTTTVKNSAFRNAEASEEGGAIYAEKSVSLVNDREGDQIVFEGAKSTGKFGGAVYARGALTLTNVYQSNLIRFEDCHIEGGTSSDGGGGAAHSGTLFTINGGAGDAGNAGKVVFENCSSTTDGGAASALTGFAANNNRGEIIFNNCSTTRTDAVGGALVCFNNNGTLSITNAENGKVAFTNCTGATNGGAIAKWSGGTTIVSGTASNPVTFTNCKTTRDNGGAIYHHSGGTTTLTNVVFGGYKTDDDGNLIPDDSGNPQTDPAKACSATGAGGAVYTAGALNYLATDGAEIGAFACHSTGAGGSLYSNGAMTLKGDADCKISFNDSHAPNDGGAIYANGLLKIGENNAGIVSFKNCYTTGNDHEGGAVFANNKFNIIDNAGIIVFNGCYTTGSQSEGGAVQVQNGGFNAQDNSGTIQFDNCYTMGSGAQGGGLSYWNAGCTIESVAGGRVTFNNCRQDGLVNGDGSSSAGAAITSWSGTTPLTITGTDANSTVFTNCYPKDGNGGAIYQTSSAPTLLKNVRFTGCHTPNGAGGTIFTNGNLTYTNTGIGESGVYGSYGTTGGAIWAGGDVSVGCTESSGTIVISDCQATKGGGGAIWQNGGSNMTLTNVMIGSPSNAELACTSKGNGGAVRANGSVTYTNTTGSVIGIFNSTTNNSGEGGAIFSQGDVSMTGITIKNCSAKTYGGAVYQNSTAENPSLYLADCVIENNSSANAGGGIYSTARTAGFHNMLSIQNNTNTQTNVVNAAGLYFTPEDTIITITGDDNTADITIYNNVNQNNANADHQSNIKAGIGAPNIEVNGLNANGGLTGKIGVVNPRDDDRWFGRSTSSKVCGEPQDPVTWADGTECHPLAMFVDDSGKYCSEYQGVLQRRLIWSPLPNHYVCKITDADGKVLKYDFGNGLNDAVFATLSDAFGAFGDYEAGNNTFNGVPAHIEMLEETYKQEMILYVPNNTEVTHLTLKTAEEGLEEAQYPYRGTAGTTCTITRNGFYGSMYVMNASDNFTVERITLDGNRSAITANQNGGIIRADSAGSELTLSHGCRLQNSATSKNGGAVYMADGTFVMAGGTKEGDGWIGGTQVRGCSAANGGGVYLAGGSGHSIGKGSTFTDNNASTNGGAVYNCVDLTVNDALFVNTSPSTNRAANGGAIYAANSCNALTIADTTFTDARASTNGGAVFSDAKTKTEIRDSGFNWSDAGQFAAKEGGAVYANGSAATLSVSGSSVFEGVRASANGGAVYSKSKIELAGVDANTAMFSNCYAGTSGGAVCASAQADAKNLLITGCRAVGAGMNGSKPTNGGGGIYTSSAATLNNVSIKECSAFSGGAVYSTNNSLILKNGTTITNNKLNDNAGARIQAAGVYMASDSSTITFGGADIVGADSATIKDNYTQTGEPANLRIAMNGANNTATSVLVLSELSGEIHIVNPGSPGTQFGKDDPERSYNAPDVFVSDFSNRYSGRDAGSPEKLIWTGEAVCKITNAKRDLMHIDGKEAIYATLTEAFSDFGSKAFDEGTPINIEIFKPMTDATGYEDTGVYMMEAGISVPGKNIILRTAERDATQYPYPSDLTGPCVVLRANTARTSSMFTLSNAAGRLTFEDIIIDGQSDKSQFASSNGGAVSVNKAGAEVNISATAAIRNAESSSNGGGIYRINGGLITIAERTEAQGAAIVACKAAYGGGVYDAQSGTAVALNWLIRDCVATSNGGGIYYPNAITVDPGDTTLRLEGCRATNGGGVYGANNLTINGAVKFDSCEATNNGGGMFCSGSFRADHGPVFRRCEAGGNGGGLCLDSGWSSATDSMAGGVELTDCEAGGSGGGVYSYCYSSNGYARTTTLGGEVRLTNCTAGGSGGGMYRNGGSTTLKAGGKVVAKNCVAANGAGGAVYHTTGRYTASIILEAQTAIELGGDGGAESCRAGTAGGGLYTTQDLTATAGGTTIRATGCTAGTDGGGLYVGGMDASGADVDVTGCAAGGRGGGVYSGGAATAGAHFVVVDCEATGHGGGMFCSGSFRADHGPVFRRCEAGGNGGGLCLDSGWSSATDSMAGGVELTDCEAGGSGGGVYSYCYSSNGYARTTTLGGEVRLTNCTAGGSGGGMYRNGGSTTLKAGGKVVAKNCVAANGAGGAVYHTTGRYTASIILEAQTAIELGGDGGAESCRAGTAGGGLYTTQDLTATAGGTTIRATGCTAGTDGGGLYVGGMDASGADVDVTGCAAGGRGGGVYSGGAATAGAHFVVVDCEATGHGGGMFCSGSFRADHGPVFRRCEAGGNGGGLCLDSGWSSATDSMAGGVELTDCEAGGSGGGVYSYCYSSNGYARTTTLGGEVRLTNCTAGGSGGGMYRNGGSTTLKAGGKVVAKNCHALNANGGGLYFNAGGRSLSNLLLEQGSSLLLGGLGQNEGCSSGQAGGGLYMPNNLSASAGDVAIISMNCSAGTDGGGIYAGGTFTVDPSKSYVEFTRCHANNGGGLFTNSTVNFATSNTSPRALPEYGLSFTDCSVKTSGGGVFLAHNSATTLAEISFVRCKAGWDGITSVTGGNGGAIYKASNSLTLSGVSITDGYASSCGGGIYFAPASTMTLSNGTTITGCTTASGARGSAIYVNSTGTVNFNGGTASNDVIDPETGDVISGNPIYGVAITGNRGAGAVEVKNDTAATLNFSGNVKIQDNLANLESGQGVSDVQKNVVLSANNNAIIRTTSSGLSEHAYVGIYVIDGVNYFNTHGKRAQDFGTYASGNGNANLNCFHNDRNGYWGEVDTDKTGSLIRWYGPLVKITDPNNNLLYYYDNSNELKPAVLSTLKSGFSTVAKELYYLGGDNQYTSGAPVKLKLLDDVDITAAETYASNRDLTFTTAETEAQSYMEPNGDAWLYTGEAKTTDGRAIINRAFNGTMITVNTNNCFTAEELLVNGDRGNNRTGRAFQINNANGTNGVVFRNMAFVSCKADNGSAIFNNANIPLAIENVIFGAARKDDSGALILDSKNNPVVDADKTCMSTGAGGAIYTSGNMTLRSTEGNLTAFYGSHTVNSNAHGGAIRARSNVSFDDNAGTITFIDCHTSAYGGDGGAVYLNENSGCFSARNNKGTITFDNCTSLAGYSDQGGAICVVNGSVDMNCIEEGKMSFRDCGTNARNDTYGGGAICVWNPASAHITLAGTASNPIVFENCYTENGAGGAVFCRGGVNLTNVRFGAMELDENGNVRLDDNGIPKADAAKACRATGSGGAVYAASGSVNIENTGSETIGFFGCKVTDPIAEGGAVHSYGAPITVTNKAGGKILFNSCTTVRGDAGAVSGNAQDVTLSNRGVGGQILFNDCRETDERTVYGAAGAICTHQNKMVTIQNSAPDTKVAFMGCTGTRAGAVWTGRFVAGDNQGEIVFENCVATMNQSTNANAGAGAVFCNSFTLTNAATGKASFTGCTATAGNGGALCVNNTQNLDGAINISGTEANPVTFTNCKATNMSGGAIYQVNGAKGLALTDVAFNDCQAKTNGGAIYTAATTQAGGTLTRVNIDGGAGTSAANGGAIYLASGALTVKDGAIRNCTTTADNTGAVHLVSGAKIYLEGDVYVYENYSGSTTQQKNVALIKDDTSSINTTDAGLGENARIGVYVVGATNKTPYTTRGLAGKDFGTFGTSQAASADSLDCLINDRDTRLVGVANTENGAHLIQWINGQICKITTDDDALLFKDAYGKTPAVYTSLTRGFTAAAGKLYQRINDTDYSEYTGDLKLKFLSDIELTDTGATYAGASKLTLTTAENDDHAATLRSWDNYTYIPTDYAAQGKSDPYSAIRVEGRAIIARAKATNSMLNINSTGGFGVENLTFNGKGDIYALNGNGGALRFGAAASGAMLTLKDADFLDMKAKNGGAVYAEGNLALNTSGAVTFTNCQATDGGGIPGERGGGAINVKKNMTALTNGVSGEQSANTLTFNRCSSPSGQGGAINIYGASQNYSNTMVIRNYGSIVFDHITSGADAGAIGVQENHLAIENDGAIAFTDCTVTNQEGGAINIDNGKLTLANGPNASLRFTRCRAGDNAGTDGGAVNAGAAVITNNEGVVNFTGCTARRNGGAMCLTGAATTGSDGKSVLRGVIINGGSEKNAVLGSAVYLAANALTVIDGSVTGCSAHGNNGGAVNLASNAKVSFEGDVVVEGNTNTASDTEHEHNVVLNQNNNTTINTTANGLGANAHIGIYVTGNMAPNETDPYKSHGDLNDPFGTQGTLDQPNLGKFTNDRNGYKGVKSATNANDPLIYWGYDFKVTKRWTDGSSHEGDTVYYRLYKVTSGSSDPNWGMTGSDMELPEGLRTSIPDVQITSNNASVSATWPETLAWRSDLNTYQNYTIGVEPTPGFFYWTDADNPANNGWYFIHGESSSTFFQWRDGPASSVSSMSNICVKFSGRVLGEGDLQDMSDSQKYLEANRGDLFYYDGQYYAMCINGAERVNDVLQKQDGVWHLNQGVIRPTNGLVPVGGANVPVDPSQPLVISYETQEEAKTEDAVIVEEGYAPSKYTNHPEATGSVAVDGVVEDRLFTLDKDSMRDADGNWTKVFTDLDENATYYAVEVGVTEAGSDVNVIDDSSPIYSPTYEYSQTDKSVIINNGPSATGKVILRKIDGESRKPLPGAKFDILGSSGSVVSVGDERLAGLESLDGGAFFVGRLPLGTYYVHEKDAPEGYNADAWFTFSVTLEEDKSVTVSEMVGPEFADSFAAAKEALGTA